MSGGRRRPAPDGGDGRPIRPAAAVGAIPGGPDDAAISRRVNGETRQDPSIDQFIWSVGELVEVVTEYLTLERGDVIATGSPPGVGRLSDGDHVAVEIGGIGTLEQDVRIP